MTQPTKAVSSPDVQRWLAEVWDCFSPGGKTSYGLLVELPFDAVMVRARGGEAVACTPRLLELVVGHDLSVIEARDVMNLVGALAGTADDDGDSSAETLVPKQALAVQNLLAAWWEQSLRRDGGETVSGYPPVVVLGLVARWPGPMNRWLGPWLERFDGPAARHLVDAVAAVALASPASPDAPVSEQADWVVVGPLVTEAWRSQDDRRGQLLAWAKTETVVNGLVLVGATHLQSGHYPKLLDDVLDVLLEG